VRIFRFFRFFWIILIINLAALGGSTSTSFSTVRRLVKDYPSPEARSEYINQMVSSGRVDEPLLLDISCDDPSEIVRAKALCALTGIAPTTKLNGQLTERLLAGGSLAERKKMAWYILASEKRLEVISERARQIAGNDPLATTLAIESLGHYPWPDDMTDTLKELFQNALADANEGERELERIAPTLREGDSVARLQLRVDSSRLIATEALRALLVQQRGMEIVKGLVAKPDTSYELLMLALEALGEAREDPEQIMALVRPHRDSLYDSVRISAESVWAKMAYQVALKAWKELEAQANKDGYSAQSYGRKAPKPPPDRVPKDQVYVIDCTGSMFMDLQKLQVQIRQQILDWVRVGFDVRVGIVLYRDNLITSGPWAVNILPLTHDVERVFRFLEAAQGAKSNDRSAAVSRGLAEAFDRMNWRDSGQRQVCLIADTPLDQPAKALAMVEFYAESIRLDVWFMTHSRRSLDLKEYLALAKAGEGKLLCSIYKLLVPGGRDSETEITLLEYDEWCN